MNEKNMIDPMVLLNKVSSTLVIDVLDHVYKLDDELLLHAPIAPPRGIYMKRTTKPLLIEGHLYYLEKNFSSGVHIQDLAQVLLVDSAILDHHGETIISRLELRKFRHLLSIGSDLPVGAINVATHLVMDRLIKSAPYARCIRTNKLHNLINDEYLYVIDEDLYEDVLYDMLDEVLAFINGDNWHIYFTRIMGTTIIIEKVIDWRIYRYHELEWLAELDNGLPHDEEIAIVVEAERISSLKKRVRRVI